MIKLLKDLYFLYKIKSPKIDANEIIYILDIDKTQLYISMESDKLFKLIFELKFTKQLVILLPPKNCKAPNKDPLWISSPEMPTLCKKDDPSTA